MRTLIFFLILFSGVSVFAQPPEGMSHPPVVKKGERITITNYMKDADVFEIEIDAEPAVGPNFVTPEELKAAIGVRGNVSDLIRKLDQEKDSVYELHRDLHLLWQMDVVKRRKSREKNSR